jgi:hypothetical protein
VEPLGGVEGPLSGHNFIPKTAFVKASLDESERCLEISRVLLTFLHGGALAQYHRDCSIRLGFSRLLLLSTCAHRMSQVTVSRLCFAPTGPGPLASRAIIG